jgi:fatty-acid desaturase
VHINHHRYTDTVDDPYDSNWRHFFRFGERQNVKATKNELRMIRDKMHVFFLNYSFLLSMVYGSLMLAIDFNAFLYLYMFPVTLYLITSGLHTIFAHEGLKTDDTRISTARNLWLLEFLIPMGGEWIHKEHHDKPKLSDWHTKPHYFDLGAIVINVIKRHDKSTA